jgi:LysR family glycine cleavage system transcriptional activator
MMRRLPGLPSLRVFEAAARHLSFTRAADELGVTPAAVSNQIRQLEEQLGRRLLNRTSRTMSLTPDGEVLRDGVAQALDSVARAIRQITTHQRPRLAITTSAAFAAKWLVPRLATFHQLHPDVDVSVDVSDRPLDFDAPDDAGAMVAIRFGAVDQPGYARDRLIDEYLFPVCSPKLLEGPHPLRQPRDLRYHTLIHLDWRSRGETWPDWPMWLSEAGATEVDFTRGMHLTQTDLVIQAALSGQGVALGNTSLVDDDLRSGRLVKPFALALKAPAMFAYSLVVPNRMLKRPIVTAFRKWMLEEAWASGAD